MPAPAWMDAGTASQLIRGVRRTWVRRAWLRLLLLPLGMTIAAVAESRAETCAIVGPFADEARWPLNHVLVVRVLKHRMVASGLGSYRFSQRMDVEVVEDLTGLEIRPRVRVVTSATWGFAGENWIPGERYDGFPPGTLCALVLQHPTSEQLRQFADMWGDDVSLIDYYFPCAGVSLQLQSLDELRTGPIAAVREAWRQRLQRVKAR